MATIYKFKSYFTEGGIGTAPVPAPVATVLDTDANTKLADAQASIARSNLPGYYEYEYSGADDLDLVCLFHTTDTDTDQQDLVSYVVDKVYQGDAKLDTIDGIVDAILVDTETTIPGTITTIDNEIAVIDGIVDDILLDTGTTLPTTLAAMKGLETALVGAYTGEEIFRLVAAVLAGKSSGGGTTTITFRDLNDTKDVIVATVNGTGDRLSVTLDVA